MGYIYLGKGSGESAFISCLIFMAVLGLICVISGRKSISIAPNSQKAIIHSARNADTDYKKMEWYELYLEKYADGRYSDEAERFLLDYSKNNDFDLRDYQKLRDMLPGTFFSINYDSLVRVRGLAPILPSN